MTEWKRTAREERGMVMEIRYSGRKECWDNITEKQWRNEENKEDKGTVMMGDERGRDRGKIKESKE